jgi:hypothetical protein
MSGMAHVLMPCKRRLEPKVEMHAAAHLATRRHTVIQAGHERGRALGRVVLAPAGSVSCLHGQ